MDNSNEIQATGSSLAVKRNDLVNTLTKFTLMEYRLFNYVAAAIRHDVDKEPKEDYIADIKISDVSDIFKIKDESRYRVFKAVAKSLQTKLVDVPTKTGNIATVGIFTKQVYNPRQGSVSVKIDVDLLPYIANLDDEFVAVSLNQARQFSSVNAWRLYELCLQWKKAGKIKFEIDELKIKLGVEGKYQTISNFEQRLLKPAVRQINDKTPLKVSYRKIKTGRRVTHIQFFVGKTLYKREAKKEIRDIQEFQEKKASVQKKNQSKKQLWDSLSDEEKQAKYPGPTGYGKFMAEN